jgi:putative hemolysin
MVTEATRNPEVLRLKLKSKRLSPRVADVLRRVLHRLLGFTQFNEIYRSVPLCDRHEFAQRFFETLGIRLLVDGEPIESVPATGPLVVVANHPSGIIEGMALEVVLGEKRPEGALMAVHNLAPFSEFADRLILVGPRGRRSRRRYSLAGWRQALKLLSRGGALAVFPAGGVSRFTWRRLRICDPPWTSQVAGLARLGKAAVLPVYFHHRNSPTFQVVGALCKPLQGLMIVGETVKLRGRTIQVSLGKVIEPRELARFANDEQAIAFLRARTEALGRS